MKYGLIYRVEGETTLAKHILISYIRISITGKNLRKFWWKLAQGLKSAFIALCSNAKIPGFVFEHKFGCIFANYNYRHCRPLRNRDGVPSPPLIIGVRTSHTSAKKKKQLISVARIFSNCWLSILDEWRRKRDVCGRMSFVLLLDEWANVCGQLEKAIHPAILVPFNHLSSATPDPDICVPSSSIHEAGLNNRFCFARSHTTSHPVPSLNEPISANIWLAIVVDW